MNDLPKIPGFEIREKLGSGGMATVYLAIQQNLDRKIALKIMNSSLATDPDFCKRFINEGKIIATVSSHPDIVTIYDIGCVDDTTYYMAMEYASGGCLTDILNERVNPEAAINIVKRMARALGYAHHHGIVHRDVKPANILFRDDGTPILTDFGIAKSLSANTQLTKIGFAIGTPDYMSPEQARAGELDGRSDLYSLGIVFYEMLTGRRPFQGDDNMSVTLMHLNDPVPPLPGRFAEYQPIIDKLLAKKPEDRFANARDLINSLDSLKQQDKYTVSDADPSASMAQTKINPEVVGTRQASPSARAGGMRLIKWFLGIPLWGQLSVVLVLFSMLTATAVTWYINRPDRQVVSSGAPRVPGPKIKVPELETKIPGPETKVPEPEKVTGSGSTEAVQERINVLLQVAEAHMAIGRYREPEGANAYEAYKLVLKLDPENKLAKRGIAEIERLTSPDQKSDSPPIQ